MRVIGIDFERLPVLRERLFVAPAAFIGLAQQVV